MGYSIYARGEFKIPEASWPAATAALREFLAEKGFEDPEIPSELRALFEAAVDRTENWWIGEHVEDDQKVLLVHPSDDQALRDTCDDQAAFMAVARFALPGTIDFRGEDNYEWRWTWDKHGLTEVDGTVVFGDDAAAPAIVKQIVEILYPKGAVPRQWKNAQAKLDQIAELLREGGFGPLAGLGLLETLATVAKED